MSSRIGKYVPNIGGLRLPFLVSLTVLVGCFDSPERRDTPDPYSVVENKATETAQFMAKEHDANADWYHELDPNSETSFEELFSGWSDHPTYSIDLERAILGNGKIVFVAELLDVTEREGQSRILFSYPGDWSDGIIFTLDASEHQISRVLDERPRFGDKYVVVAAVSDVSRPALRLEPFVETEEDASVEVSFAEYPFYAVGELVEFAVIRLEED